VDTVRTVAGSLSDSQPWTPSIKARQTRNGAEAAFLPLLTPCGDGQVSKPRSRDTADPVVAVEKNRG
jgi:hypothetical protein